MFKSIFSDMKFLIMLIVAIATIFSPIWLKKIEKPDKELDVKVLSKSALQIPTNSAASDLKLMLGGKELTNSYLSILLISNQGKSPIRSSDFDTPLEIRIGKQQSIVRAVVTNRSPKEVQAKLDTDNQTIHLEPTLLNPQDSITIEILSVGGLPRYDYSSRVIGMRTLTVLNTLQNNISLIAVVLALLLAYLMTIPTAVLMIKVQNRNELNGQLFRRRTVWLMWVASIWASESMIETFLKEIEERPYAWHIIVSSLILIAMAFPLAIWLERKTPSD